MAYGCMLSFTRPGNDATDVIMVGSVQQAKFNIAWTAGRLITVNMPMAFKAPVTKTGTSYSVGDGDDNLIINSSGTFTLTLPAASSNTGRILRVLTIAANAVNSASSNVTPLTSATPGTAILTSTSGKWAYLQSDGTNWNILEGN